MAEEGPTANPSRDNHRAIPVSYMVHRGPRRFAILMVEQRGEEIMLDAQVTDGCTIILDEASGTALFDLLGTWLG